MADNDQNETLERIQRAMKDGARLDLVRLHFNRSQHWGVYVWELGKTRAGNDKWVKVVLLVPSEGETVSDLLLMLGKMAEES